MRVLQNLHGLAQLGPVDVVSIGEKETAEHFDFVREWKHFPQLARTRTIWDRLYARTWRLRFRDHPAMDAYWYGEVARWMSTWMIERKYDLAVIEELSLSRYLPLLRRHIRPVVYDAHNVESILATEIGSASRQHAATWWRRMSQRVKQRRVRREERRLCASADLIWACSDTDARSFGGLFDAGSRVTVVPNAINVPAYQDGNRPGLTSGNDWSALPVTLLYMGSFAYYPNEHAALRLLNDILPEIRKRAADVRALIVGRDPTPAMREAAQKTRGVVITGSVESIMPFLREPCVVALPIVLGGGTRLKILEAFAAGRPVVSTPKGAEGIAVTDGEHLFLRDEARQFADAVLQLWREAGFRKRMCTAAFELVNTTYSWSSTAVRIAGSLGRGVADGR